MFRKLIKTMSLVILVVSILVFGLLHRDRAAQQFRDVSGTVFKLPSLSDASYDWIGSRIYQNEARGQADQLTHWNEGEDFPSLGIGHFIWFPPGVDAPFDEQFPGMVFFVRRKTPDSLQMPEWLQDLEPFEAPWNSKKQFDQAWSGPEMSELRDWLEETQQYQARFIVSTFEQRWRNLDLPVQQKQDFNGLLAQLVATPEGLFALVDYYNFKGLGNNPRERYQGQGWGLLQVLEAMSEPQEYEENCSDIVERFRDAAAGRLQLRVELSLPERNESRWLAGWLRRLEAYLVNKPAIGQLGRCGFRVTPYLQNPAKDAVTLSWLSNDTGAGRLKVWKSDTGVSDPAVVVESHGVLAEALAYHPYENCMNEDCAGLPLPYLHRLRLTGLESGSLYRYEVRQGGRQAGGSFSTMADKDQAIRFIVYGDSETEPESTGKHAFWPSDEESGHLRTYLVDQSTGYAQNLKIIRSRKPGFVAIAGDLVESGGEQRDWDEFWKHNAELAATSFILPALGNHDYFAGPGILGNYKVENSENAVRKYQTYFDFPDNGSDNETHANRYYAIRYGPISLIVLDTNDGQPHRSDQDTNWKLRGHNDGGSAPDWHPGSEQHSWLKNELKRAQETSRFTFVMFHPAPYTVGVHGQVPGEAPGEDILSSVPLQALTPLFLSYGVDAVFSGHDEMYEHSVVPGLETLHDGTSRDHEIHFIDIGIGGDGLRGPLKTVLNPHQVFLAHTDAPEIYASDGVLRDGGKHYGHMEVNVGKNSDGQWQAQFDAVYVFPLLDSNRHVLGFERRLYDDSFTLTTNNLE